MIANRRFNTKNTTIRLSKFGKNVYEFRFFQDKKKLGYVALHPVTDDPTLFETHSMVFHEALRGRGLGIFMYSVAVDWATNQGFRVQSTPRYLQSANANSLWTSTRLRQKYLVLQYGAVWTIRPKSTNLLRGVSIVKVKKNTYQLIPKWHPAVAAVAA